MVFITHGGSTTSFWNWKPEGPALYGLSEATLSKVFAYQSAAILFDVLLGPKARGQTKVTDISILFLAEESSFLSALGSLICSNSLARLRFHGFRSECTEDTYEKKGVSTRIACKFLFLLVLAPIANLAGVILILENEKTISFEDADFGTVGFGINEDLSSVTLIRANPYCKRFMHRRVKHETPPASFFLCQTELRTTIGFVPKTTRISIGHGIHQTDRDEAFNREDQFITISIDSPNTRVVVESFVNVRIRGKIYRLKRAAGVQAGETLLQVGRKMLSRNCQAGQVDSDPPQIPLNLTTQGQGWRVSQEISCRDLSESLIRGAVYEMQEAITLINVGKFQVAEVIERKVAADVGQLHVGGQSILSAENAKLRELRNNSRHCDQLGI